MPDGREALGRTLAQVGSSVLENRAGWPPSPLQAQFLPNQEDPACERRHFMGRFVGGQKATPLTISFTYPSDGITALCYQAQLPNAT